MVGKTADQASGTERLEDYEYRDMVYCKIVKTYVEITLCKSGGPMNAAGPCRYFGGIEHDRHGNQLVIHSVPSRQPVTKMIFKEKENGH